MSGRVPKNSKSKCDMGVCKKPIMNESINKPKASAGKKPKTERKNKASKPKPKKTSKAPKSKTGRKFVVYEVLSTESECSCSDCGGSTDGNSSSWSSYSSDSDCSDYSSTSSGSCGSFRPRGKCCNTSY